MPTIGQPDLLRMRRRLGDLIQLAHRAIFVIQALHQQQRRGNALSFRPNVKAGKAFRQPNVIPLPEGAIYIRMVFGQSLS